MTFRPEDAIDAQLKLWKHWHDHPEWALDYMTKLHIGHTSPAEKLQHYDRGDLTPSRVGRSLYELVREIAGYSPTYMVMPEMTYVITTAAQQLFERSVESGDWPTPNPSELMTKSGFVVGKFPGLDVAENDEPFTFDGFMWKETDGIVYWTPDGEQVNGRGIAVLSLMEVEGTLFPFDVTGWAYDAPWEYLPGTDYDTNWRPGLTTQSSAWNRVFLYSFFHFIQSRVDVRKAGRHARRRWERHGPTTSPEWGSVRVVALRKSKTSAHGDPDEEHSREWTHRWVVSGHWRNQWYPSEGQHKPIWIDPYVKGDPDKPLIQKDTVFKVVR